MGNSRPILSWTDQAIIHWIEQGVKLQEGVPADKLHDFEKSLDYTFPQDFIELYTKVNGFRDLDWNENMFSLWPLDS